MSIKRLTTALFGLGMGIAAAPASPAQPDPVPRFDATHEFTVPAPPAEVFPLFLPEGESRWAPSWRPRAVVPDTIRAERNAVFLTGAEEHPVVWTVVGFDPQAYSVDYLVVDPGFQQRWVSVRCRASGKHSVVTVTYVTTALSPEGVDALRRYDRDFVREWEEPVRRAVAAGR